MEHLTYHQVLADHYEETGKTALVVPQEYENDVEPHEKNEHVELENQEEFQKFIPRHDLSTLTKPHSDSDKHNTSVQYTRQTQKRLINIDSRYRDGFANSISKFADIALDEISLYNNNTSSTDFLFRLKEPIKNVISVRLSSIEIPNSFYTFSLARGNTSFELIYPSGSSNTYLITIPDGNWDSGDNTSITSLVYQVQLAIQNALASPTIISPLITVNYVNDNPGQGKIFISDLIVGGISQPFDINWRVGLNNNRVSDFGLGYNLGFRQLFYTPITNPDYNGRSYYAEAVINTLDTNYIFLTLDPDWKVIEQQTPDRTQLFSFAKVVIDQPKFAIVYDNGQNTLTKEYFLRQPTNIISIPVRISDPYDQDIDLNGLDFSFTLELTEVLNSGLYESMRS
jgi:hypothetical protein